MFFHVAAFEINFNRRQHLIYTICGIFFLLTFLATSTPNVSIGGDDSNLNTNAYWSIVTSLTVLNIFGLFAAIAFVSGAVLRDFEYKTAELFFTTGVSRRDYVLGRFAGAFPVVLLIHVASMLGMMLAEFAPWLDEERLAPFSFAPYWFATWAMAVPNLFFLSAFFFCVATLTRSEMATYVAAVFLLMLYFLLGALNDRETLTIINLLDPFGLSSWGEITRYWTVFEKNSVLPALQGELLINRVIWVALGVVSLLAAYRYFPFSLEAGNQRSSKVSDATVDDDIAEPVTVSENLELTQYAGFQVAAIQYLSQLKLEMQAILKSIPFIVVMALGLLLVVGNSLGNLEAMFGTDVYPVTGTMIAVINGAFSFSLLVVLIYYSGELMSRERSHKVSEMMDAMPHSDWVMLGAKLSASILVIVMMLLGAIVASIGVQAFMGFYEFRPAEYLTGVFLFFQFSLYLMCVLAIVFYLITRSKYLSMFLMVLYVISLIALPGLGYDHYLYLMSVPRPPYSAFTGHSHNLVANLWFSFYWFLWGVLLLVLARLLWPRGTEDRWRMILKTAKKRLSNGILSAGGALVVMITLTGSWIYYNTNQLNEYTTRDDREQQSVNYEVQFRQHADQVQPSIISVYAEVDIFPEEEEVRINGRYDLENMDSAPINDLHFSLPALAKVAALNVPGATMRLNDEELGYRIYEFEKPLMPGETLRIDFKVDWLTPGFENRSSTQKLVSNGTFFNNQDTFPQIGYDAGRTLQDNNLRRKHDLPPLERAKHINDPLGISQAVLGTQSRVNFETIVSTSSDQIALAPGYLQKEWEDDGRKYYHYKMDAPIWNFFSFMSAEYKVKKKQWNDVSIEVYYVHDYNVDRMIEATEKSLSYFEDNFSPYQYRQFRILEFPRFQGRFAQSFPNTIPFSEGIGFVADLRDKTKIDYVFYVTAHELAHQWWAHQVMSANVQGSTMIVESLSQYFALMVMEEEYGKETMRRFLKYEMDNYLSNRGGEVIEELPLYLVENQPYIHYRKASVNLYALQDYVGKDKINGALREFIVDYAFKGAPFPTTLDLLAKFRSVAGPEHQQLITDLFEKIVLYDLKVKEQTVSQMDDGRWEVKLDLETRKFEADGKGQETEVPLEGWFDIGVLGEKQGEMKVPEVIYLDKHQLNGTEHSIRLVVDKEPVSVGIDPLNKLIDRNPEDNLMRVEG